MLEHQTPSRRTSDIENKTLDERIFLLDKDVKNLRVEFDDHRRQTNISDSEMAKTIRQLDEKINTHLANEEIQRKKLNSNIETITTGIQTNLASITLLRDELVEPLEVYKTVKYGAKASRIVASTVKIVILIIVGALTGLGIMSESTGKKTQAAIESIHIPAQTQE